MALDNFKSAYEDVTLVKDKYMYDMVIVLYQGGSKLTYPLNMVAIFIIDRHKMNKVVVKDHTKNNNVTFNLNGLLVT